MSLKLSNEYSRRFGPLYSAIPKAVFAAVAYSYTSSGGDDDKHGIQRFVEEWRILHENGIVRQKPPKLINDGIVVDGSLVCMGQRSSESFSPSRSIRQPHTAGAE